MPAGPLNDEEVEEGGRVSGKAWAVMMAVVKKVMTATIDLRENLDIPQSMCPLVQPDPSCPKKPSCEPGYLRWV